MNEPNTSNAPGVEDSGLQEASTASTVPVPEMARNADSKSFAQTFRYGCAFWTSEDGTLMSVVIDREEGWQERLKFNHASIWQHEAFDESRAKPRFVFRHWVGSEYFDGGFQRKGKLWTLTDEPTPFPVMDYELLKPR